MWSTPTHLGSAVDAITATTWNFYRSTQCTLTPTYRARNNGILLYSPGAYRGDGLARLYNDGQNYKAGGQALSTGTDGDNLSGYTIGLANQLEGSRNNPQTVTFNVTCSTYLLKTEQEGLTKAQVPALAANPDSARVMPMEGMVVADAESSNWDATHNESSRRVRSSRSISCSRAPRPRGARPLPWRSGIRGTTAAVRIRGIAFIQIGLSAPPRIRSRAMAPSP